MKTYRVTPMNGVAFEIEAEFVERDENRYTFICEIDDADGQSREHVEASFMIVDISSIEPLTPED